VAVTPADDTNLTTLYSEQDYIDVATDNDEFVTITANTIGMHLYKDRSMVGQLPVNIIARAKSSIAPTLSTVYLQIYNRTLGEWENLTSNNTAGAGEEFQMNASQTLSLEDYFDADNRVACRIYQSMG